MLKTMRRLERMYPENVAVSDFTPQHLAQFCLSGSNPAPSTIKQRRAWCRSTFAWFKYRDLIDIDPAADLLYLVTTGSGVRRLGTWLTAEQIRQAYNAFDPTSPIQLRNRLMFLVGVMTGLRAGELVSLRWDSFGPDMATAVVTRKGGGQGEIHLAPQLQHELVNWRQTAPSDASTVFPSFKSLWAPDIGKRVITALWDQPVTEAVMTTMCREVSDRLRVNVTPHDLRRTFADLFYEQAARSGQDPLRATQEALGHRNIATTQRYLASNPNRTKAAMSEFRLALS